MFRILSLAAALALAGCGGGGGDAAPPDVAIAWSQSTYTIAAPQTSVQTVVTLGGASLPPTLAVSIQPSRSGLVLGTPPFFMNAAKQVPVTVTVESGLGGQRVTGEWTLTATANIDGRSYSATTTIVSR